jgi:hypothetical protein
VIAAINDEQQQVWVRHTKEQISEAPELGRGRDRRRAAS